MNKNMTNFNLPNKLSLFRIFLVPVLVVVIITRYSPVLAVSIFILAAVTDWLDGYIARSRKQITTMGQLLDPIADKLLICSAFISLVEIGQVRAWMVVLIVGRELAVTGLRAMAAAQEQRVIEASLWGKGKTVSQIVAIVLLILGADLACLEFPGKLAMWLALGLTVASGLDYLWRFRRVALPEGEKR